MPPSAKTGALETRQASRSASRPCARLPGVSKTGAKTTKSAVECAAFSAECTLCATSESPRARASSGEMLREVRCRPAPSASSTSARSLTKRLDLYLLQIAARVRARYKSSRGGKVCLSWIAAVQGGSAESAASTAGRGSPSGIVIKYRRGTADLCITRSIRILLLAKSEDHRRFLQRG